MKSTTLLIQVIKAIIFINVAGRSPLPVSSFRIPALSILCTTKYIGPYPQPEIVCTLSPGCGAPTRLWPCVLSVHVVLIVVSVRASSRSLSSSEHVCDLLPRQLRLGPRKAHSVFGTRNFFRLGPRKAHCMLDTRNFLKHRVSWSQS